MGRLPSEELPGIAADALENGYDSPSLRQLAGAAGQTGNQLRVLFLKAARELNLTVPPPAEAGLLLAKGIAREVLEARLEPYKGAKRIWSEVYTSFPELKELLPFVGCASEYEDDEAGMDYYAGIIVEECKKLLGKN